MRGVSYNSSLGAINLEAHTVTAATIYEYNINLHVVSVTKWHTSSTTTTELNITGSLWVVSVN